jgi:hypothetical protein
MSINYLPLILELLFSFIIGFILGIVLAYLFIRNKRVWLSYSMFIGANSGIVFLLKNTFSEFNVDKSHFLGLTTFCMFILSITTLYGISLLVKKIKEESKLDVLKITFIDILVGGGKVFEKHYKYRKDQIDKDLKYSELVLQKKEIDNKIEILKDKERVNKDQEARINILLENNILCIDVPISFKQPLDYHIINRLPEYFKCLSNFVRYTTESTIDFFNKIENLPKENNPIYLKTYLNWISSNFQTAFFKSDDVRIHFRILDDNKLYVPYTVWGGSNSERKLTPIPVGSGLIYHAGKEKRSLVKSANVDLNYVTRNNVKWEDYLTIIFEDELFFKGENPILSMGVSVRHAESYSDLLRFLSFIRIEEVIQYFLLKVDTKLPIIKNLK